jgi:hypothetical protein
MASPASSQHGLHEVKHVLNSWAVFTLLITTAYSSGLVSHLTVPTYSKPLDTIRALVEGDIYWSSTYYPAVEILFDTEVCVFSCISRCTYFHQDKSPIDTICLHYLPHFSACRPASGTHVYCWLQCSKTLPFPAASVYSGYILRCLLSILGCNYTIYILVKTLNIRNLNCQNCFKILFKLKSF